MYKRILFSAGTLHLVSTAVGGYVMNNANPLDIIFDRPYSMDITSHLVNVIEQAIGVIEGDAVFYKRIEEKSKDEDRDYDVWALIHPQVAEV